MRGVLWVVVCLCWLGCAGQERDATGGTGGVSGGDGDGDGDVPGDGDGDGDLTGDGDGDSAGDGDGDSAGDGDGDLAGDGDGDLVGDGDGDTPTDSDADGLPDSWERAAMAPTVLSPGAADTDGNGTPDGAEDPDGDGLTNLEEWALGRLRSEGTAHGPDPMRRSLVVELDAMAGLALSPAILQRVAAAFDDLPLGEGIDVHFYRDEEQIPGADFDGSFAPRHAALRDHGPTFGDTDAPPIPYDKLVHVLVARRRTDLPERGAEVVTDGGGDADKAGVLVYRVALSDLELPCAPPITFEESLSDSLAHELGHVLQLGHDTAIGGGENFFNLMSQPASCLDAQARFHGTGNANPELGATEAVGAGRFSAAAVELMDFSKQLSVSTAALDNGGRGHEM